jgi:hypothetical protein
MHQNTITMKNDWTHNGERFTSDDIGDFYGYVYRITNLVNGHDYVGRKYFNTVRKLKPLMGFKRKRKVIKETDWKEYWGSSKRLLEDIEKHGKHNFKREIICLCDTRGQTNYMEAKIQFEEDVLIKENNYNGIIAIKLGQGSINKLAERYVQSD